MRDSKKKPSVPSTNPVLCEITGMPNPRGERYDERVALFGRKVSRGQHHHPRFGCEQGSLSEALTFCDYRVKFGSALKRFKIRFHYEGPIGPPSAVLRSLLKRLQSFF